VIVLDEPTAGVDVELRQTLWQFVARLNKRGPHGAADDALPRGGRGAVRPHRDAQAGPRGRARPHVGAAGRHREHDAALQDRHAAAAALAAQSRVTGRIVQITAHDAAEVEPCWRAARRRLPAEDLEIGRADLEDVFLEIMQGTPCEAAA
jgi:ABC-2 type transport system ATP-binding protein